ncbi:MAG: hypothetical protein ACKVYV_05495, partial [Limisphaerales bacterium]
MPFESTTYTIRIEGEWSLEDFYHFPRTYEQVYFIVHSLTSNRSDKDLERIRSLYRAFPWRGGYSAVNFYEGLKCVTPKKNRPQVASIQYASPGWLEIALVLTVAFGVERLIKSVANSVQHSQNVYTNIVRGMTERKLLRLEAKRKELQL